MIAPPAGPVHLIPGNKSTRKRHAAQDDPDRAPWSHRLSDEAPARRRRLLLPAVAIRHDRRDPAVAAADQAQRSALKRAASDALGAILGQTSPGQPIGELPVSDADRLWLYRRAAALDTCQEVRAFREAQCGQYEVMPISCRVRVCPDCERVRAGRVVRIVSALLDQVPKRRRSFVVLTIRNMPRLAPGLDRLQRGLASLRRRPIVRGGRCRWRTRDGRPGHPCSSTSCTRWTAGRHRADRNCPDYRHAAVEGGGAFYEVTYDVTRRLWHPHANLLLDAPYIAQAELADTWRAITCVDARHRRAGWCPAECTAGSSIVWIQRVDPGTVREAVKYVTKSADLIAGDDAAELVEFMLATRGRRMVQGFGSFYGLELVEDEPSARDTVSLAVDTGQHDSAGRAVVIRFRLPRLCRQCGRDTQAGDGCTYEAPVIVPRDEVRLRNGFASWHPRARSPDVS